MLYIFDLDGTLIRSFMREGQRDAYDEVEVLPGRRGKLRELHDAGHSIAIATNQGGVAFGYQTEEQVRDKTRRALDALGIREATDFGAAVYACFKHPKAKLEQYRADSLDRKPHAGMLVKAMWDHGAQPEGTVFVGDMETDREAAFRAGVRYKDADEFFYG